MTLRTPTPIDLAQLEAKILGRQAGMHWYTLIIEPQSWRRVAERAGEMGYATYCPMAKSVEVRRGRKFVIDRPLLGGYMFVDMPEGRRRFDLFQPDADSEDGIRGCRGLLCLDGSPIAVHEAEIQSMSLRENNGEFDFTALDDLPKWATMGRRVQLGEGPFEGKFARILQTAKGGLVRIMLFMFGGEMPIDVPVKWLRPA
jgi:transcription antitermination factor NusG